MRRIRSKNTAPELLLRKLLRSLLYRYKRHARNLPGRPDFVFPARHKVLFLHGCFWHLHGRCKISRIPKSRRSYWKPKLEGNKQRDSKNRARLRALGWRSLTVWECQLADLDSVKRRVKSFLRQTS
jgi:DNA mismatch endonuclease (patch repair protein)